MPLGCPSILCYKVHGIVLVQIVICVAEHFRDDSEELMVTSQAPR